MAYKIKKSTQRTAKELHFNYIEMNNKSHEVYGTDFDKLSWKEQKKISEKVAKGFHWKVH